MDVYDFLDKRFKILVLRKLSELQRKYRKTVTQNQEKNTSAKIRSLIDINNKNE